MTPNTDPENGSSLSEGATVVLSVPIDIVDQVLEFIDSLPAEDSDVRGYMISRGMGSFGGGSSMGFTNTTHTGITTFVTGAEGTDLKWADDDTVTTGA